MNYVYLLIFMIWGSTLVAKDEVILDLTYSEVKLHRDGAEPIKSKKFSNGNTFVSLYSKGNGRSFPWAKKDITIFASQSIDADRLMEILLTSYSAKKMFARSVKIVLSGDVKIDLDFPVDELFAVANVDEVCRVDSCKKLDKISTILPDEVANQGFLVGGENHKVLRNQIANKLGKSGLGFDELLEEDITGKTVYYVSSPTRQSNKDLLETLVQMRSLRKKGAAVILISPYLPYARSDKAELNYGVSAQGALVARLLEASGMSAAMVVRPHAAQSIGFFNKPVVDIPGQKTVANYFKDESRRIDFVISPDAGFQKDATLYADQLNVPVIVMNKQRSHEGIAKHIGHVDLDPVRGKSVVVMDDEISNGGTLASVVDQLSTAGASQIYVVVTHLAGSASKVLAKKNKITQFVVTNTLKISEDLESEIEVLSIADEIVDHIKSLEKVPHKKLVAIDIGSAKIKHRIESYQGDSLVCVDEGSDRLGLEADRAKNGGLLSSDMVRRLEKRLVAIRKVAEADGREVVYKVMATAAFRDARNGQDVARSLGEKLGFSVSVIDQDTEAKLGFQTARELRKTDESICVWDHGGGSFQITCREADKDYIYKASLGSQDAFRRLRKIQAEGEDKSILIPVKSSDADTFVNDSLGLLTQPDPEFLRVFRNSKMVAIGGQTSIAGIVSTAIGKRNICRNDLWEAIQLHLSMSKSELSAKFLNTSTATILPRLLVAYTVMVKLEADNVIWEASEGNTVGILKLLKQEVEKSKER